MLPDHIRLKNINHITYNVKNKDAVLRWLSSAKIRFTSSLWPVKTSDRAICRRIVLHLSLTDPYHFAQALVLGPEWAQRKKTAHKSRHVQRTSMRHRHTDDTESE